MSQLTCPTCQTDYYVRTEQDPLRHNAKKHCDACGTLLKTWHSTTDYIFTLVKYGPSIELIVSPKCLGSGKCSTCKGNGKDADGQLCFYGCCGTGKCGECHSLGEVPRTRPKMK